MQETFHRYSLIRELTKKHSHSTYLAFPTNKPDYQVVLTIFSASLFHSPNEREKLLQKVRRLKELEHPHLVPILKMGIEEEQPFVVRPYLPNGSLRHRLKQLSPDSLELEEALTLVLQVGEALAYAHVHNIVHRNIKPENILFDANNQAVLADFCLVSRKDAFIRDQTLQEYAFCYLAPEQLAGTSDAKSDQYALGCLTYELIAGKPPFAAQSLPSMMRQPRPALLSESVLNLPSFLETAVHRALAHNPAERFFDFSLFLGAIKSSLSSPPALPLANAMPSPPQSVELSGASSRAEIDGGEDAIPLTFQASMPEWTGIIPVSEPLETVLQPDSLITSFFQDANTLDDGENQKPIAFFEQQEADASSTTASTRSFYGYSEPTRPQEIVAVKKSPEIAALWNKISQYSRRGVLELILLLSIIVSVICAVLWWSGIITPQTSLSIAKRTIQAGIYLTNTPTVQPSIQTTQTASIQTTQTAMAQRSAQTTQSAMVPSGVYITSTPITQASFPAPAPTSYEAAAPQNTLANGAEVASCSICSGGEKVRFIGFDSTRETHGILQFNDVSERNSSNYQLTMYYMDGDTNRTVYISVNGGLGTAYTVPSLGSWNKLGTFRLTISLSAGNNTIAFSNPSGPAPDMDRIVV